MAYKPTAVVRPIASFRTNVAMYKSVKDACEMKEVDMVHLRKQISLASIRASFAS